MAQVSPFVVQICASRTCSYKAEQHPMDRWGLPQRLQYSYSYFTPLLLVVWCIMVVPIPPTANGDLPKELSTAVAITSTAKVTITTIGDKYFNQRNVKSSERDVSVRPYCHGVCESSYNQLQVGDTLLIPNNGSADIISGHHPDTATHHRVFIRGCDPLTATNEMRPHLVFYILCDSGPSTSNFLTVFGVEQQSASWSVTEPFNCTLDGSAKVGDVGMFFQNSKGEIFVAVTTTKGVGVCSLETGTPNFIPTPSYCPNIARLSQFDPENILVECTSSKDSQSVVQVGLFSIPGAQFGQKLPLPQYDVGQIVFSGDRLVVATWKDKTVKLANLSESNPPSATVVAKGNVDSAHIIGSGITSQLVVVAKGGVEQYDLHAVFDGKREPKTLEGSQNVLTRFDDPSSPTAQVVELCLIIPTRKGSTYGMALLSLNGDKPKAIPGVRPARFAVYPGVNVTNSTDETESKMARVDVYFAIGGAVGVVIFTVIVLSPLIVAAIFEIRKMKRNHDK